jgi:hypothetical protein
MHTSCAGLRQCDSTQVGANRVTRSGLAQPVWCDRNQVPSQWRSQSTRVEKWRGSSRFSGLVSRDNAAQTVEWERAPTMRGPLTAHGISAFPVAAIAIARLCRRFRFALPILGKRASGVVGLGEFALRITANVPLVAVRRDRLPFSSASFACHHSTPVECLPEWYANI